ncbi:putative lipid II flippase FtsW [Nakamurella leprariae]|uniref:Probable peptidoglycan glycosyltransferase FtsW n=1 Tax=Nakamurella leprariae TaxID=2803911 RepID=A0A938YK39_9ACTN|nr:putative lipid II flippase FtsW [Nakamurella leprariae]MBM9469250.1 putative lipid II flippase FtsW [Nakamurella leprariae]
MSLAESRSGATEPEERERRPELPEQRSPRRNAREPHGSGGRVRRGARTVRRVGADWLDRPMTSLHLVLAVFLLLLGVGLLMVLSSSSVSAFRAAGSSFSTFQSQLTYAGVGLLCFFAAQYLPVRLMRTLSTAAVIVSLLLLAAVLVPGVGVLLNGARSWIRVGGFQFQPSEVAKLALLLWMAHVLASRRQTLGSVRALLIPVLPVFALMGALIMAQPDLGTTVALGIVFLAVMYFAGAPWWMFGGLAVTAVAGVVALAVAEPYRLVRITAFMDPDSHPASSYQLLQSLYGLANGGWFGVGLGQSRAKWSYLPNADSDFIFAIIGEELGFVGCAVVLLLFALLAYTGLRIARRNVDPFVKIVASSCTVWLVGQAAINVGYVVGLLPVTGITLPMISTGGTSLIITMIVFGLLANFARTEPEAAVALNTVNGGRVARFLGMRNAESVRSERAQRRALKRRTRERAKSERQRPAVATAARRAPSRRPAEAPPTRAPRATERGQAPAGPRRGTGSRPARRGDALPPLPDRAPRITGPTRRDGGPTAGGGRNGRGGRG